MAPPPHGEGIAGTHQPVDHLRHAESADGAVHRVGASRAQPRGQARQPTLVQRAVDGEQPDRAHGRGDQQAHRQRLGKEDEHIVGHA
jgi:hypothetical protein